MALYVDCAYLDDITNVAQAVPLVGVTSNPSLLLSAYERGQRLNPDQLLREMLRQLGGTILIQPGAVEEEAMLNEAIAYIEADPKRVIPKIPMTVVGMRVALRLRVDKHRFAFTAVHTVAQAYSAALVGAEAIIPYFNRLERSGINASERIHHMAQLLNAHRFSTRIIVASIKSRSEAESALLSGANDLTVPPQVLLELITDPQSEEAVAKFQQDWQKMKIL